MEWDIAAAQIILEAAGGSLIRVDDKSPMQYNRADMLNPSFLAFGHTNQAKLIAQIGI